MKLKCFLLIIIILCGLSTSKASEKVRVNIIGYPKLDSFKIQLNDNSILTIDNKKIADKEIFIQPKNQKVIFENKNELQFNKITLISNGSIIFNSFAGDQKYDGDFFINSTDESISIINEIELEEYFASVLGSEMGGGFSIEALKASAVAIRTYFYTKKEDYKNTDYHINNADGIDMVYRGSTFATKKMYRAFSETDGLFLYEKSGRLALPLFHSTSGGIILKNEVMHSDFNEILSDPVLLYDKDEKGTPLSINSPYFKYSLILTEQEIKQILSPKFKIRAINGVKLKYFQKTKCVDYIGFVESNSKINWIKGYQFVSLTQKNGYYDLRSIQFNIDKIGDKFYFKGQGFGHLCGMSQYSAETLARKGFNFKDILKKYYPQLELKKTGNIFS